MKTRKETETIFDFLLSSLTATGVPPITRLCIRASEVDHENPETHVQVGFGQGLVKARDIVPPVPSLKQH